AQDQKDRYVARPPPRLCRLHERVHDGRARDLGGRLPVVRRAFQLATGFATSTSRLTSQAQKLDSVDCRTRMVVSAKSVPAMSSIQAWITGGVTSVTRARRP